jgi:hypothetical protein
LKPLKREREVGRIDEKQIQTGRGEVRDTLFSEGGDTASFLLEGSQATPDRPSHRNNVKAKTS